MEKGSLESQLAHWGGTGKRDKRGRIWLEYISKCNYFFLDRFKLNETIVNFKRLYFYIIAVWLETIESKKSIVCVKMQEEDYKF